MGLGAIYPRPHWSVSMSFASEIFRRTILEGGSGWILIYRSFYGLINRIHLGEGRDTAVVG